MAVEYIQVTLDDFEKQFNIPHKKDPSKRAFELFRPEGQEAYYLCTLFESETGTLYVKVYTSVSSDRRKARDVGKDAIRIVLAWEDKEDGWFKCLNKGKRVYRSGGEGAVADDVIKRAIDRARDMAREAFDASKVEKCPKCSRPMVPRQGASWFYGCIGYSKNKTCNGTKPIPIQYHHRFQNSKWSNYGN